MLYAYKQCMQDLGTLRIERKNIQVSYGNKCTAWFVISVLVALSCEMFLLGERLQPVDGEQGAAGTQQGWC